MIWWTCCIDQLDSMIVDPSIFGRFGSQVQRKHVRKVDILDKNLCKSLFSYQAVYLKSKRRMNIKRKGVGQHNGIDWHNTNYVDLIFRVKFCSCNSFSILTQYIWWLNRPLGWYKSSIRVPNLRNQCLHHSKGEKNILETTFGVTLATRKIFSKNLTRFALSITEKVATTIL